MKTSANLVLAALMAIACREASAQMFKCTDAAGKTTYSSTRCSDLGLKDAGEVANRLQITPAPPDPTPAARQGAPSGRNDRDEPVRKPAAAAPEEAKPERRCFTITGAGGKKVTRCNDKPDEPAN